VPRPLRIAFPGALYHVTARGVNGERIYVENRDRVRFDRLFGGLVLGRDWRCLTVCQMGNHFHAVVQTADPDISSGIQWLNGVYAQDFNRRYGRTGHLFQGRFHTELIVREAHLLEACRYAVRNPVRARICRDPGDWEWSSYRALAGSAPPPLYLDVETVLSEFSSNRERARQLYREFIADGWP
jgi:REP element-mobilizing transposase RayT